ncbi:unnamed protein product [Protopolystoma xenopodis]|uniref:Uncharacterized protein n=1 Tax=Protopolystoma xenopodis TaxID=117903 RepID=A0A3S5B3Q7_9PLAT|nr:unnamed protein product [Protopolystoma xenopodis]
MSNVGHSIEHESGHAWYNTVEALRGLIEKSVDWIVYISRLWAMETRNNRKERISKPETGSTQDEIVERLMKETRRASSSDEQTRGEAFELLKRQLVLEFLNKDEATEEERDENEDTSAQIPRWNLLLSSVVESHAHAARMLILQSEEDSKPRSDDPPRILVYERQLPSKAQVYFELLNTKFLQCPLSIYASQVKLDDELEEAAAWRFTDLVLRSGRPTPREYLRRRLSDMQTQLRSSKAVRVRRNRVSWLAMAGLVRDEEEEDFSKLGRKEIDEEEAKIASIGGENGKGETTFEGEMVRVVEAAMRWLESAKLDDFLATLKGRPGSGKKVSQIDIERQNSFKNCME